MYRLCEGIHASIVMDFREYNDFMNELSSLRVANADFQERLRVQESNILYLTSDPPTKLELEFKVRELQGFNDNQFELLTARDEEIRDLKQALRDLEEVIKGLRVNLYAKKDNETRLMNDLVYVNECNRNQAETIKGFWAARPKMDQYDNEIRRLQGIISDLENQIRNQAQSLAMAENEEVSLRGALEASQGQVANQSMTIRDGWESIGRAGKALSELRAEEETLKDYNETLKAENHELHLRIWAAKASLQG